MKIILLLVSFVACFALPAQVRQRPSTSSAISKPRLVVGIVIDQMRWDYLYRYADRFGKNGFKRLLREGFNCQNTFIPYTPTVTAAGHACVYTGSVPNIHGIVGNNWYEEKWKKTVYCTDDSAAKSVGTTGKSGNMSPVNMLATSICDELRLATNFRGKTIGIALKDRGAILPAGHSANAAYWYDDPTGSFITSTWYMNELPAWVNSFNARKLPDSLMKGGWHTLYPSASYVQSTGDEQKYEGRFKIKASAAFPYDFTAGDPANRDMIRTTPMGNTLTASFAKTAVISEALGKDSITDFLAVSFSSTDYIGHQFGPNSVENEDDYLRLDLELASFFDFLDQQVGKGAYTVFLTADHAVAHVPGFSTDNKLPGGLFSGSRIMKELNQQLKTKLGLDSLVTAIVNYQVHLNHALLNGQSVDEKVLFTTISDYLLAQPAISQVVPLKNAATATVNAVIREKLINGYYPGRSGDIQFVLKPGYVDHGAEGTSHGVWNPYDSHIPLLFMGWGVQTGSTHRETYMTDIAATVAAILNIQMPSGCVGKVIEEGIK